METSFVIADELKKLPARPGVYLMHDAKDDIIYVGKAVSLRNRVRQYFQAGYSRSPKIEQMVSRIRRFEYIVTDSELEALVLENNLIKEHRPKYNTMLTDDKTYPFIKVTIHEDFPRILRTRQMKKDKSRYFGPFSSSLAVGDTIDLLRRLYRLRDCNRAVGPGKEAGRPCLYYHLHQCDAPCQGGITKEAYRENVDKALDFLEGNVRPVVSMLEEKMQKASEEMDFEQAIVYRDLLESVRHVSQKQKITSEDAQDRDVLASAADGEDAIVQVFFVRGGLLIGRDHFWVKTGMNSRKSQILGSFIQQYYAGTPVIPRELMLECEVEDQELLEKWLSEKRGSRVYLRVPRRGTKEKLVEMAAENASTMLQKDRERIRREEGRTIGAVREIEQLLGLENIRRMEAFDISNISGYQSVGSMVVFDMGRPKKNDYRKFRIRSVRGPDDYASMEEVLTRRFSEGLQGSDRFPVFPDLILMDGGKGQVHVALRVLESLKLSIPVCGMVKDDFHRTRGIFFNEREVPIDTGSEGFKLVTRIQDEAHRFAIEYHRKLRGKEQVHSVLDDIPGIGPARRKALMRYFASLEEVRGAGVETLRQVPSMNAASAEAVFRFFHPQEGGAISSPGSSAVSAPESGAGSSPEDGAVSSPEHSE